MRLRSFCAAAALLAASLLAAAQEQAFTNRATELKERGAADARTVASLPEGAQVKVLERGGGWTRVESGGQEGWLRVFHLRFPATAQVAAPSSGTGFLQGITGGLGFGREQPKTTTIATTGIRGLSPEDLKNASPDNAALGRMESYRADSAAAERFAREGKLAPVRVDEGGTR